MIEAMFFVSWISNPIGLHEAYNNVINDQLYALIDFIIETDHYKPHCWYL
ncbi:predicted protein [Botrytis cinerea T4]|uniref:Uncharacterized protein n=1 Tax=Botryotinia fuckeliana (strain T4) TaxID=999810 RepID=G2YQC0_BOTF4|nr:predicted protein [Botrytis cinerea T4]